MSKEDNIYTAGLIDGEGTVTLTNYKKTGNRAPTVSVSSTSKELLQYLKNVYGGTISIQKKYDERYKDSWSWKVAYRKAISFLRKIYPYLKENKKKKRAKFIIDNYHKVTLRNGRYNKKQLKEKLKFEEDFFKPL